MTHFQRRYLLGTTGAILVGTGLCLTLEAAFVKHSNPENYLWVAYGTGALSVFMAGLSLLLDANFSRMKHYFEKHRS